MDNQRNNQNDEQKFIQQNPVRSPYSNYADPGYTNFSYTSSGQANSDKMSPGQTSPARASASSYPVYTPGHSGAYAVRPPQHNAVTGQRGVYPELPGRPLPSVVYGQPYRGAVDSKSDTKKKSRWDGAFFNKQTLVAMAMGFAVCAVIGIFGSIMVAASRPNTAVSPQRTPQADGAISSQNTPKTNTAAPADERDMLSYAQIAAKVRPSIVGVTLYADLPSYYGGGESIYSQGSGVVLTSDGYIVTNSHVIDNANHSKFKITVTVTDENNDNEEYLASVVGYDARTDLAVIKINTQNLTPAALGDSDALVQGDNVAALGNPGGAQFAGSISSGIVSGLDRVVDENGAVNDGAMRYIQTDAPINPGNSGGALVNMYGQVIGINSAKIVASGYEGLGFAIPINTAVPIINQLRENGIVMRAVLGITCTEVTEQVAAWYDVPVGLRISGIRDDSDLAEKAQEGDIITMADGKAITTLGELQAVLDSHQVGDVIKLTIFREGQTFDIDAKLIGNQN